MCPRPCYSKTPLLFWIWLREAVVGWEKKGVSQPSRKVEFTQSCPTLCDPMDFSPPVSSVHGIFQVRILDLVAIFFSRGSSLLRDWTKFFCIAGRVFTSWATGEAFPGGALILPFKTSHLDPCLQNTHSKYLPYYWKWKCQSLSHVQLFVTPWTVAHQAPLFMGFSRQEYWSG